MCMKKNVERSRLLQFHIFSQIKLVAMQQCRALNYYDRRLHKPPS